MEVRRRAAEAPSTVHLVGSDRFGPVDFDRFHRIELPGLLGTAGPVLSDADVAVLRPIGFRLPGGNGYTCLPAGRSFTVEPGTDRADTVIELADDAWRAFRWELRTSFALLYAQELTVARGSFGQLVRWEPPLRAAIDGQPIYDIDDPPPVVDADGRPLDTGRSFSLDDGHDELADFLDRAGYLHLRRVLDPAEIDALRQVVETAVSRARPDDRRSWWTAVDGTDVCTRVNYLNEQSEQVAGLGKDERFVGIARLGGPDLRDACDRLDGNGVVIKVPGAGKGLADLPWHRDCGMGGHPVKCPMLNVGIQLDPATAGTGQLQMVPGSHRGTSRLPGPREADGLPVVALDTEPGDVTVHFGHTLHAAPPPTGRRGRGRRALYLSFVPPLTFEMVGPGQGYNDVLFTTGGGHVRHADDLDGRRGDGLDGRGDLNQPCRGSHGRPGRIGPASSPAQLGEPVVVDPEVVADLVDHRLAHGRHHLLGRAAVRADGRHEDGDPVRNGGRVVVAPAGQRDALVEAQQGTDDARVVDDHGDVVHVPAELGRDPVERVGHQLLELLHRQRNHRHILAQHACPASAQGCLLRRRTGSRG